MNDKKKTYSDIIGACGVGLRLEFIDQVLDERPDIPWFEIITDNFMQKDSVQQQYLSEIAAHYPLCFHGVGLNLGAQASVDEQYIQQLKFLVDAFDPLIVSDHLCWTNIAGMHSHNLLPLPYIEQSIETISDNIKRIQDHLRRALVVENVSSYLTFSQSVMPEWEFITQIIDRSGCGLLLDINNVHINAFNHGFSGIEFLSNIPHQAVREIHLAGYSDQGTHYLDTHGAPVDDKVWQLYRHYLSEYQVNVPTLIEWDADIPPLEKIMHEANKAQVILDRSSQ